MSTPEVSVREAEVLAALGAGMSNAQIARRLRISVRTVEGHVSSLLRKYAVADRRALAGRAQPAATNSGRLIAPGEVPGLPARRTSFVGRDTEIAEVIAALGAGRLVTLVGPGGVGKTRLAEQVAAAAASLFPHGGVFVDLVPVRDQQVGAAVAAVLDTVGATYQSADQAALDRLGRTESLLVLDNCEHLADAAAEFVERLLDSGPTVVLATSREPLRLPGEHVYALRPLPPESDAQQLFRDRADPRFEADPQTVADLCVRLDGLPLAIELAAARSGSLGATGLLAGLGDYLRLLAGGRGPVVRHRSLRGVLQWSHDLLEPDEQTVFCQLAVFVGVFDLAAAAAVVARPPAETADLLGRLADKSLLTPALHGWRLLDTIRAYGLEKLDAGQDAAEVRERHLSWAVSAANDLVGQLDGDWRERFDAMANDLRTALEATPVHRLAVALARLTFARGYPVEAAARYEKAADLVRSDVVHDLGDAAACALVAENSRRAYELWLTAADCADPTAGRAYALARAVEIAGRFELTMTPPVPLGQRRSLLDEATTAADSGGSELTAWLACAAAWTTSPQVVTPDPELATAAVAAARAHGDPVLLSASLDAAETAALNLGRTREVAEISAERLKLVETLDSSRPRDAVEIDDCRALASLNALSLGDLPRARAAARLVHDHELHGDGAYLTDSKVIPSAVMDGDLDRAVELADPMWDSWLAAGRPAAVWMLDRTTYFVALAHGLRGNPAKAALWRSRGSEPRGLTSSRQSRLTALRIFVDARLAIHTSDTEQAAVLVEQAFNAKVDGRYVPYARATVAELAVIAALPEAAELLAALTAVEHEWASACVLRATGRLSGDQAVLARAAERWRAMGARIEYAVTLLLLPDQVADGRAELSRRGAAPPR